MEQVGLYSRPKNPPNSGTFFAAGNTNPVDTYSDLGVAPGGGGGPRTMSLLDEDSPRLLPVVGDGRLPHNTVDMININAWRQTTDNFVPQQPLPTGAAAAAAGQNEFSAHHHFPEIIAVKKVVKADSDARYSDSVYGDKGCGSPCFIATLAVVGALLVAAVIASVVMIKII